MNKSRVAFILVTGLTYLVRTGAAQTAAGAVVAVVDGQPVSQTDLEARIGDKLLRLKTEEYNIRLSTLNGYVDELMLAREAGSRQLSVDELLGREVTGKLAPVSEAEARAVMESAPGAYKGLTPDEALRGATAAITGPRAARLRANLIADIRARHTFELTLEPPRLGHPIPGGRSAGSDDAPVYIVEFSDFQCPYCGRLTDGLDQIRREYGRGVRLTYKQFPLPSHPQAAKAAEASLCAAEQGKFWEMHDQLFSEQRLLAAEAFSELAGRAGANVETFESCLKTNKTKGEIAKDKADGSSVGVNSTPTFFINGKMFVGVRSYEALKDLVEAELSKTETDAKRRKEPAERAGR